LKGYVQVYTGDGKGKTTAALGLSLRAAGAGLKVFIGQFMKLGDYSEIKALKRLTEHITVEQFGPGKFVIGKPSQADREAAEKGIERIKHAVFSGRYDMVVMEEANVAAACGLFPVAKILSIMDEKPDTVELLITGRNAAPMVIEKADLVTEMKEIKHYFKQGVPARIGIEK